MISRRSSGPKPSRSARDAGTLERYRPTSPRERPAVPMRLAAAGRRARPPQPSACLTGPSGGGGEPVGVRRVRGEGEGLGKALLQQGLVDERAVVDPVDVGEETV